MQLVSSTLFMWGLVPKLKDSAFEGSYISEGINEMKDFVAITELNSV